MVMSQPDSLRQAPRGVVATLLRAPVAGEPWLNTIQVLVGFPLAVIASTVVISLVASAFTLAVTAVLAVPFMVLLFGCCRIFTQWQYARLAGLGVPLPAGETAPVGPELAEDSWWRQFVAQLRSGGTWRQVAYHSLSGLVSPISVVAVLGAWTLGPVLSVLALYAWALPSRIFFGVPPHRPGVMILATLIGLVLVFAAPWIAVLAGRIDYALARALLSPSRSELLAQRVDSLSRSRADVIDATDAERRRIERDLHDGTQQRLVSLAMNLGMARTTLVGVPEGVRDAIEQAHEEAKLALSELRDVVRGMHPAILDDLGLDAALSGVAARSPVPVRLLVELPERPPAAVETAAYFVVSEALTNVAKHANATQIDVVVEMTDSVLRIIVSDNGRGGADPSRGSGLRGLRQRVGALDGGLRIDSPPGGPTLLVVELPCG